MKTPVDNELLAFMGQQIRSARLTSGYSQQQFAEMLDVSIQTLSKIETGKQGVSVTMLRNCCQLLHISGDRLLFGDAIEENDVTLFLEQLKRVDKAYLPSLRDVMEHHISFLSEMEQIHAQKSKDHPNSDSGI